MSAEASAARRDVDEHQVLEDLAPAVAERPPAAETFEQTSLFEVEPVSPAIAAAPRLPGAELRNEHRGAFFYTTLEASNVLAAHFPVALEKSGEPTGERLILKTATAIYSAFTRLSNDARSDEFPATRENVADRAGVVVRTLDKYVRQFEKAGLIEAVRQPHSGRRHDPNLWRLIHVRADAGGAASDTSREDLGAQPVTPLGPSRGAVSDTHLKKKGIKEGNVIPLRNRLGVAPGRDFSRFDRVVRR